MQTAKRQQPGILSATTRVSTGARRSRAPLVPLSSGAWSAARKHRPPTASRCHRSPQCRWTSWGTFSEGLSMRRRTRRLSRGGCPVSEADICQRSWGAAGQHVCYLPEGHSGIHLCACSWTEEGAPPAPESSRVKAYPPRLEAEITIAARELWWAQEVPEYPPDKDRWMRAAAALPRDEMLRLVDQSDQTSG